MSSLLTTYGASGSRLVPVGTALSPRQNAKTSANPALGPVSFPMSRVSRSCDLPALDDRLVDFGPVRADDEHLILAALGPKRLLDNNRNRLSQNTIFRNRAGNSGASDGTWL